MLGITMLLLHEDAGLEFGLIVYLLCSPRMNLFCSENLDRVFAVDIAGAGPDGRSCDEISTLREEGVSMIMERRVG